MNEQNNNIKEEEILNLEKPKLVRQTAVTYEGKPNLKYQYEDILEMMNGYTYYSINQIKYIYYKCNGMDEEAEYWLEKCGEEFGHVLSENNKLTREGDTNNKNSN